MMRRTSLALCLLGVGLASPALAQRPVIERISPTSGPPGIELQIVGRNMGRTSEALLGGVSLPVQRRLPNRWTVLVPEGARSGPIVIRTSQGEFAGPYFRVTAAPPGPAVSGIQPSSGPPGTEVVIQGQNFSSRLSDNVVFLNDRPVVIRSATPTQLRVIVPTEASSGAFTVRVINAGQTTSATFNVTAGTSITSVEPSMGPVGSQVVIRGTGFSPRRNSNRVFLNNRPVRLTRSSPTELVLTIPRRATTGHLLVDVRGAGRAQSPSPFVVQEVPTIRSFAPQGGPPGTLVTIRGTNFGSDPRVVRVTLGGRNLTLRRVLPNEIQVEVPQGAAAGQIEVKVHDLTATSTGSFGAVAPLSIASFTPTSGAVGSEVTLSGQGFDVNPRNNNVTLGGVRCAVLRANPTQLVLTVPQANSGPFVAAVHGQTAQSRRPFLVTTPPFIADVQPPAGPVGSAVTIRGANFGTRRGLVRVTLGNRQMQVQSVSDQQIVAVVPRGARNGQITVTVGTQGGATSRNVFQVEALRQVSGISPTTGFPGTQVVIRGQGFPAGRSNRVQFNGAQPVVAQRVSPVELRVGVPQGATTGPVNVLLPNNRTMPAGTFTVSAAPAGTGITAVEPQCAYPGCVAVLRGHGFSSRANQNRVFWNGNVVRVRSATPTTLTVTVPAQTGNGRFEVRVRRGGTAQSPPFMVIPRP